MPYNYTSEESKEYKGELVRCKKFRIVTFILGATCICWLVTNANKGHTVIDFIAGLVLVISAGIYERELRVYGYLRGYNQGFSDAKDGTEYSVYTHVNPPNF